MALWAAIPHTSTGNTTPSQPASGTNGRSQASVLGTTPDYWKPCAVARFRSVLGPPSDLIRDRDGLRESARSANLRVIGALGAAKRPPQVPQESRSRAARCDVGWPSRDRPPKSRDRETVYDFVDANTVDRMHRRTRSPRGRTGHAFEACYFIPDNDGYPVVTPSGHMRWDWWACRHSGQISPASCTGWASALKRTRRVWSAASRSPTTSRSGRRTTGGRWRSARFSHAHE